MAQREILLLGNGKLYDICREMGKEERVKIEQVVEDLHDTILAFRGKYGFGRAIAAPQIDESVRIIYMHIDGKGTPMVNPRLEPIGDETYELWDDCMSFPGLEAYVRRWKSIRLHFKDLEWNDHVLELEGDLSELLQHEYDHLDGILSVQRALDNKAFRMNPSKMGCL